MKVTFDYIVVGSGPAGSVIANRLSENENLNVLLIEAGGDPTRGSFIPLFEPFGMKDENHCFDYKAEISTNSGLAMKNGISYRSGKML